MQNDVKITVWTETRSAKSNWAASELEITTLKSGIFVCPDTELEGKHLCDIHKMQNFLPRTLTLTNDISITSIKTSDHFHSKFMFL